jgi:hypothetical protein
MKRAVAAAINPLVVRVLAGRFIELRVGAKKCACVLCPRLMPEHVDLRDQAHAGAARRGRDLLHVVK